MKRVIGNKGVPGVDKMITEQLQSHIANNWNQIEAELLEGRYKQKPVREVEIPKIAKWKDRRKASLRLRLSRS